MKNIQLWSRVTDRKILVAIGFLCCLAFAAVIGATLPTPAESDAIRFVDAFISTMLLVLVWGGFRLVRPARYRQPWVLAEVIAVPVIWTLLVIALAFWFGQLHDELYPEFESIRNVAILYKPAAGNAGITPQLAIEHHWPRHY